LQAFLLAKTASTQKRHSRRYSAQMVEDLIDNSAIAAGSAIQGCLEGMEGLFLIMEARCRTDGHIINSNTKGCRMPNARDSQRKPENRLRNSGRQRETAVRFTSGLPI
jgi:hypothetical protein